MKRTSLGTCLVIAVTLAAPAYAGQVKLDGHLEGREGGELIIDGQRVRSGSRVKLEGHGPGFAAIPPGYEVRSNGGALFEDDLRQSFDALLRENYRAE